VVKVGVINYFLDEFHGTYYSQWLNEKSAGEVRVCYAYSLVDEPPADHLFPLLKRTSDKWCADLSVERCPDLNELIDKSDALLVCCPDYPEYHEELARLPLSSGKPVFVDKVFAPDLTTAKRMFDIANAHNTPVFSCSALRFLPEFQNVNTDDIVDAAFWGGADDAHIVHQIEPLTLLVKSRAKRMQCLMSGDYSRYVIEFEDGRHASMAGYHTIKNTPILINLFHRNEHETITIQSDIFNNFILELIDFLKTGDVKVKQADTLHIVSLYETALKARLSPGEWLPVNG